ncbi:MHS family proline/betaine transporter-like MFS transporter [Arcanobacterium wilhelmae]|uniref:MHS family proline/betaine transporter-like MFS transporter n=1 Tax=Arcanobacterium wilhelmae TaxID=1803177 RepID=A0ABT9NCX1_9ACTO|nr:MFS transporter [Arcanobacterium wilhelmae]MDP9801559.1 MHS family proline/betaine transporter-like MFS transporter [Arcanobacterium wilhelmae]
MNQRTRRLSMLIAASGTVIEWFDFSLFFYLATSLSATYYPNSENSTLLVLAIAAVGFVFRPLGAVVFGHIGDTRGRTVALIASAGLMAVSMAGIALTPGYATIGAWGGIIVLLFRALAGFSVGAEYTGIMVYLTETARPNRRGLAASWAAANSEVGALLAVGSAALVTRIFGTEALHDWAWRLPFVLGAFFAAGMIPLRKYMAESPAVTTSADSSVARPDGGAQVASRSAAGFVARVSQAGHPASADADGAAASTPLMYTFREQKMAVLVSFLISTVGSASYFLTITYIPTYVESMNTDSMTALRLGIVAAVAAIVVTPFVGLAADVFGRRRAFIATLLALLALAVPGYAMLSSGSAWVLGVAAALLAAPAAAWSAIAASSVPEQFPAHGRFSGMAIGYNLAAVLFGGLTPAVVSMLTSATGNLLAPAYYAIAVSVCAGVPALWLMREKISVRA